MKGREFETLAEEYLKSKGYKILGKNIHTRYGEIDILAEYDGKKIVIEVKGGNKFFPVENFTKKKFLKVLKTSYEIFEGEDFQIELIVVYKNKIYHYKNLGIDYEEVF
ncbi:MAG: YraN family protein [Aquifex sp.]|nr:MAG: YraN family protein [Aquifex sp.]